MSEVSFHYAHDCIVIIFKIEKKGTVLLASYLLMQSFRSFISCFVRESLVEDKEMKDYVV